MAKSKAVSQLFAWATCFNFARLLKSKSKYPVKIKTPKPAINLRPFIFTKRLIMAIITKIIKPTNKNLPSQAKSNPEYVAINPVRKVVKAVIASAFCERFPEVRVLNPKENPLVKVNSPIKSILNGINLRVNIKITKNTTVMIRDHIP